jgi:hypothetical protein
MSGHVATDAKIAELEAEEVGLCKRLNLIRDAKRAIQKLCTHSMVSVGHDSHKEHYECTKCHETEEW